VSQDHISALIVYGDTLPSGFGSSDRIKKIYSLKDAESLGINDTYTDETKATGGAVEITVKGATGDVETISLDGASLGSYTILSTDATTDDVATGLTAAINALTTEHGFSAAVNGVTTDQVDVTAPDGMGVVINSGTGTLAFASSGTGTATVTQFTSGVGSLFKAVHYHIDEYFRIRPDGVLYVGWYAQGTFDGAEIETVQDYAEGEIRQMAVYVSHEAFATSQVDACQTYTAIVRAKYEPLSIIFHSDFSAVTLANVTNLTTLTDSDVSVLIGEDGNWHQSAYSNTQNYIQGDKVVWLNKSYIAKRSASGNAPYDTDYWSEVSERIQAINGFSVSCLGNALGTVSKAAVHENIGWVEQFAVNDGNVLDVSGFATGDLYDSQTTSLLDTLNDYHYVFLRKYTGRSDTYYNDSYTAIAITSDYATIENNRVMDKAERLIYTAVVAKLNSPLYVNADGTLTEDTLALFTNTAKAPLVQMQRDAEISDLSVTIDPDQDVLTTSTLEINVVLLPVGVARDIVINSGFTTKIV